MTDLSICVVSYNNKKLLEECLYSIYKNINTLNYEIFVIDNNSNDGNVDMVKDKFPMVTIIANGSNVGFARANNQAIQKAKGRYVLLLNQDTVILDNKSINIMVDFLNKNPNVGVCGCRHIRPSGDSQSSYRNFPTLMHILMKFFYKYFYNINYKNSERLLNLSVNHEVDSISGACFLVRREVVEKVGSLDDDYYFYYEETDWCYRIKKYGWKIYWLPWIDIIHYAGCGKPATLKLDIAEFFCEFDLKPVA